MAQGPRRQRAPAEESPTRGAAVSRASGAGCAVLVSRFEQSRRLLRTVASS